MLCFFFQAEDGIRDQGLVTGVQTCALPIYHKKDDPNKKEEPDVPEVPVPSGPTVEISDVTAEEIGRASCRERV